MKKLSILFLLVFTLVGCAQSPSEEPTTTYFFIRHAEKDLSDPSNKNPKLTQEGKTRAQEWAKTLAETKVDLVFSTNYSRTLQTAEPIAKSQGIETLLYDPRNLNDSNFQQKTKGKTCVIVGHSNTTPSFVNKIIGKEKYSSIDEKDYSKLYIINITGNTITDTVLTIN
ncbi:SixA phosphatase family protein [Aquimarina sp. 2304DJ70-9]|uniref:SixA phosphatase family protein n=1 Tax=Aquimarina penaris TaxID=3231044 RepID=UPI003461B661